MLDNWDLVTQNLTELNKIRNNPNITTEKILSRVNSNSKKKQKGHQIDPGQEQNFDLDNDDCLNYDKIFIDGDGYFYIVEETYDFFNRAEHEENAGRIRYLMNTNKNIIKKFNGLDKSIKKLNTYVKLSNTMKTGQMLTDRSDNNTANMDFGEIEENPKLTNSKGQENCIAKND